jgi:hypothetical protein
MYSCLGDLSVLPLFAALFCIPIACTARTVPARAEPPELVLLLRSIACTARTVLARAEPPEPRPAAEILLRIGGQ